MNPPTTMKEAATLTEETRLKAEYRESATLTAAAEGSWKVEREGRDSS